jgi:predicted acyl esterase
MAKRMDSKRLALIAFAIPVAAAAQVQPVVQPGGDIPSATRSATGPPPRLVANPLAAFFRYERREVFIPMRDGTRLYAVLIMPKGGGKYPIMLDRTPYSADKRTNLGPAGPQPETIMSPLDAELVRAGYILAIEDVRGKYRSEGY